MLPYRLHASALCPRILRLGLRLHLPQHRPGIVLWLATQLLVNSVLEVVQPDTLKVREGSPPRLGIPDDLVFQTILFAELSHTVKSLDIPPCQSIT